MSYGTETTWKPLSRILPHRNKAIIKNSMPKVKMEIGVKQTFQPRKCVCQPSTGEVTIELDRASAFEFIKFWDHQTPKKQFKLSYDTADFNSNPDILKVTKITAVPPPVRNIEEVYEISIDDVGKIVKLVKVQDGTFHYKVENSERDVNEIDDNVEEMIVEENPRSCEISGIYMLDDSQVEDATELVISTPDEPSTTPAQNRPPVIIRNEASVQNRSTQNEHLPEPATPKSDQSLVEMEVDAMEETNQGKNSPTKLQKQLAEVAPFHHNKVSPPKRTQMTKQMLNEEFKNCRIQIGPNNTTVPGNVYHAINWSSVREATRKLLSATFPREVLASHSLTGKPSPAFRNLPTKKRLNPAIVDDIVHIVSKKCNVDARTVRGVITLKCADENKMLRIRKRKEMEILDRAENNKENCG